LGDVVRAAGLDPSATAAETAVGPGTLSAPTAFSLPGRPSLEQFFREHVIDVVENLDRYRPLGINFPAPIVLHGPPGSGKTFAVAQLVDFLGWPSYDIDASTIGSPYIHETSRKIASVFDLASGNSPSVVVIDEMDSFLSDRADAGVGSHRVEEVAEFLRRLQGASADNVLVLGMTNRLDTIDPAALRRGRFDHVIEVELPSTEELTQALVAIVQRLPTDPEVDLSEIASALSGRHLSDLGFVVREAGRLAARAGRSMISRSDFLGAIEAATMHTKAQSPARIGFRPES
jgi:ATP-dependent 26S proteasome regulatory subunit